MSIAFHGSEIAHLDAETRLYFGALADLTSFTEADVLTLSSRNPEVWEELKDIVDHAKVVDTWLRRTAGGELVDVSDEEKWSGLVVSDAMIYPVLSGLAAGIEGIVSS